MGAYVLIQTQAGSGPIAAELETIDGITGADDLQGPYDAIAFARAAPSRPSLNELVDAIKELPEVTRVVSAAVIDRGRAYAGEAA